MYLVSHRESKTFLSHQQGLAVFLAGYLTFLFDRNDMVDLNRSGSLPGSGFQSQYKHFQ